MTSVRYDLTAQVEPFLDSELFKKINEFNGTANPTPSASAPSSGEPSLENAQQLYKAGKFAEASDMLGNLKSKANPASDEYEMIVWGKLAADLLAHPEAPATESKESKSEDVEEEEDAESAAAASSPANASENDVVLQSLAGAHEMLDLRRSSDSTVQLNRRAWLIHWSLFAYFNGRLPKLVDTYFTSQYMSVIHAACPWILRYVVIAVVVTHPRTARFNRRVKDAIRVVQQELYEYNDPVLQFVQSLYIDYDFTNVASALERAAETVRNDYFAHNLVDQFVENGRVLIADSFLRVHEYVPAATLSATLGLNDSESSQWIQKYIQSKQDAKLDAIFNENNQTVRVSYAKPSIYTQVADKVKNIDQRAHQIQVQQSKKSEEVQ